MRLKNLGTLALASMLGSTALVSGLSQFAVAQTAQPAAAPTAAEATAAALKKAAEGAKPKAAATAASTPATDAAAPVAKPSALAKAKAMLPWNKAKAAKAAAAAKADGTAADPSTAAAPAKAAPKATAAAKAPAAAVVPAAASVAAAAAVAAKPEAAKPADKPATDKPVTADKPVATKAVVARTAPKPKADAAPGASTGGDQVSSSMAATVAVFGGGPAINTAPPRSDVGKLSGGCTRLAHSAIEVGKETPTRYAREGIDNQIATISKTKGWKASAKSNEKVTCTEYINLGPFGQEYTCRVDVTVCPK
jgi:hypothetical protein